MKVKSSVSGFIKLYFLKGIRNEVNSMNLVDTLLTGLSTTIIGMGIVFITLIFLAFIVSLLKYIESPKKDHAVNKIAVAEMPATEIQEILEEEQVEESELVAVITAAIAASMGTTADKLRVVSLRRSMKNQWNNTARREQQRQVY